jgi:hypothetical protein
MRPGNLLGNHGQRPIALALVFKPVLANEDGMGMTAPLPYKSRAGLQHYAGIERKSAVLEAAGGAAARGSCRHGRGAAADRRAP